MTTTELFTPSNRRWKGTRQPVTRDWLVGMAAFRAKAAQMRRQYPNQDLALTEYGFARRNAMRPVVSRLRQADMLARGQMLVSEVVRIRAAMGLEVAA